MPKTCTKCGHENLVQAAACEDCGRQFGGSFIDWRVVGAIAIVGVMVWSVWSILGHEDDPAGTSGPDAGAVMGCLAFEQTVADGSAGILTDNELRDRLAEVYDDVVVSDVPGLTDAARRALAAATQGDPAELRAAMADISTACGEM